MKYCLKQNLFKRRHTASSKRCSKCYTVSSRAEPVARNIKYNLEQKLSQVPRNTASSRTCSKYEYYVKVARAYTLPNIMQYCLEENHFQVVCNVASSRNCSKHYVILLQIEPFPITVSYTEQVVLGADEKQLVRKFHICLFT